MFQYLQLRPRPVQLSIFFVLFGLISVLDLVLDHDFSLYALDLIPALYAVWFLGNRWGYAACVGSALLWLADDLTHEAFHRSAFVSHWNLGTRTAVLVLVVALVERMKEAFERLDELKTQQVRREFEMAREVQLRLLPSQPPSFSGLHLSYVYQPALMVGGDYYDFVRISPERLCIAVADISGKGLPSALLMASLQGLIHNAPGLAEGSLSEFAGALNSSLYELTANNHYATVFLGIVDTARHTFEYVNAGHNPPLLFRSDPMTHTVTAECLDHAGIPLGLFPKVIYEGQQLVLREGDVLVLYTDGVTEALNSAGVEFGLARLRAAVTSALRLPALEIRAHVKERLLDFVGETPQYDDITLVVGKIAS